MNLLLQLEKYLKRIPLADKIGTNKAYLSVSSQKADLPIGLEERVRDAAEEIVKELIDILKTNKKRKR